jgi:hypothetical protein
MIGPRGFDCDVGVTGVVVAGAGTGTEVEVTSELWPPPEVIIEVITETLVLLELGEFAARLFVELVVEDVVAGVIWLDIELELDVCAA